MHKILKKKIFPILSFIFIITIIVFFKLKTKNKNNFQIRKTQNLNIEQICLQSNEDLLSYYQKSTFPYSQNSISVYSKALIDYFVTRDTNYLTHNYLTRASRFLSILLLIIIIILSYIIRLFCYCCPCCCCKQKDKGNCLKYFSVLMALIMSGSLITTGYYGKSMEYKFISSINGLTCSVFKFIYHFYKGDSCNEKPIWSGFYIFKIIQKTQNIIINLDLFNNYIVKDIEKLNEMDFYTRIYKEEEFVKNENEFFKNLNLSFKSPNPNDNSTNITFDFLYNISNINNYIINDFKKVIYEPFEILKLIANFIIELKSKEDILIASLNNSLDKILIFQRTFNFLAFDTRETWNTYLNKFSKYGNLFLEFFFPFFIFLGIINICCILFYVTFDFQWTRIPMFLIWNIETLVLFISLIFGLFFSLLYLEGKDGRDIINYSLTSYNLNNDGIIFKGEGKKFLDICFNDDGDLQSVFELNIKELNVINELIQYKNISDKGIEIINKEFDKVKSEILFFENYLENIENSSYYLKDKKFEFNEILNEFRKYSDGNYEGNYQFKDKLYDVWVFNKKYCPDGYKYISLNDTYSISNNNCLLFTERNAFPYNYSLILTKGNYENLEIAFKVFYKSLSIYFEKLKNFLLKRVIPHYKNYYSNLTEIKTVIKKDLNIIKKNISSLCDLYNPYINQNESLFSFANCRFMNRDKNIFFSQIDKLGYHSANLASINYTLSFSLMLSNIFFFFIMMRYKKENRKIDVDEIIIEKVEEKKITVPENISEYNKQIQDLINNQNNLSFNQEDNSLK